MDALQRAGLLRELLAAKDQLKAAVGLAKAKAVATILDLRKRLQMPTTDKGKETPIEEVLKMSFVPLELKDVLENQNAKYIQGQSKVNWRDIKDLDDELNFPYLSGNTRLDVEKYAKYVRTAKKICKAYGITIPAEEKKVMDRILKEDRVYAKLRKQESEESDAKYQIQYQGDIAWRNERIYDNLDRTGVILESLGRGYTPHGEMLPSSVNGAKRGKPMDHESANGRRANPFYDPLSKDESYSRNCQTCVVAYEMRRRGYDVMAGPKIDHRSNASCTVSYLFTLPWIDPKTGAYPIEQVNVKVRNVKSAIKWFEETVKAGERYILKVVWKSKKFGHVMILNRDDEGKLFIYDPQTGWKYEKPEEIQYVLKKIKFFYEPFNFSPALLRCDNLELNMPVVRKIIRKRDGTEPN